MIGLTGAQRTGKSTLAKAYAERAGIKFLQTDVVGTFARLGFDAKKDYPFDLRLHIQGEILKDCEALYERAGVNWITDRTPICMLAYTLADVTRQSLTQELESELDAYAKACIDVCNRHFTTLIVLQPGIKAVDAPGKAPASPGFMEHMNALCLGLSVDERIKAYHYYIPRDMLSLTRRVEAVQYAVTRSQDRYKEVVAKQVAAGERPAHLQ